MVAANDIGALLNLACLKHTGQVLPVTFNGSPEWRPGSILDDEETGHSAKGWKFNPYADRLLTRPFASVTDSHPIEQQIKRTMLISELKEVFMPKINIEDIMYAMIFKASPLGDKERLPGRLELGLCYLREEYIKQEPLIELLHQSNTNNRYDPTYEVINELPIKATTAQGQNSIRNRANAYSFQQQLLTMIQASHHTKELAEILARQYNPNKVQKKVDNIRGICMRYNRGGESRYNTNTQYKVKPREDFGGKSWQGVSTGGGYYHYSPVKKAYWSPWFWYSRAEGIDYEEWKYKDSHNKRSKGKGNWWKHICEESGLNAHAYNNYWGGDDPHYYTPKGEEFNKKLLNTILTQV